MRPLTIGHPVGTHVLYTGLPDVVLVTDEAVTAGHILGERHPGVVTDVDPQLGVCVSFFGLEDEPVSQARFLTDHRGTVPGLVVASSDEWTAARATGWWSGIAS